MSRKSIVSFLLAAVTLGAAACGAGPGGPSYEASASARRYPITGVVRGVDASSRQLSVAHEAIPGLMDAMTMSFPVKEAWAVDVARAGDRLSGTLVVDQGRSWIEVVSLGKPVAGEAAAGGAASATDAGIGPAPGTPVPTTPLRDQAGRVVTARAFAGRDVVLTFIYTRCPLPDFCPLMMTRLNEAAARLRKAGRRDEVQMVAISIDPERDTPEVLTAYGRQHIVGEEGDPFHRWSLLTGTPEQVRAWAGFFALTYEKERNEIAHGLRTAVLDREGRVVGVLRGNQWSTDELMTLLPSR